MEKSCPTLTIGSYESNRAKALQKIRNAAEDSDIEVLSEIAKEDDPKERASREVNCDVIHRVVDKCVNNYRKGEYSYKETVDMIVKSLKAVK